MTPQVDEFEKERLLASEQWKQRQALRGAPRTFQPPAPKPPTIGEAPPAPMDPGMFDAANDAAASRVTGPTSNLPGGALPGPPPAPAAPPMQKGPETQRYDEMLAKGPRRSWVGTVANGVLNGLAGYANASGKDMPRIETKDRRDWIYRAPKGMGGGPWDEALKRQGARVGVEQTEQRRQTDATKADLDRRKFEEEVVGNRNRDEYYKGRVEAEKDKDRNTAENQRMQRLEKMYGPETEIIPLKPGEAPPSAEWSIVKSPYSDEPQGRYAVRRKPQAEVSEDVGALLGYEKGPDGKRREPSKGEATRQLKLMMDSQKAEAQRTAELLRIQLQAARDAATDADRDASRALSAKNNEINQGLRTDAKNNKLQEDKDRVLRAASKEFTAEGASDAVKQAAKAKAQMALDAYEQATGGEHFVIQPDFSVKKATAPAPAGGGRGGPQAKTAQDYLKKRGL